MKIINSGAYRKVILIGDYAIKISRFDSLRDFYKGCAMNCTEVKWFVDFTDKDTSRFCPILFNFIGIFIVMPRCEIVSREDFFNIDNSKYLNQPELKQDSFGYYKDNIVAIDYGD